MGTDRQQKFNSQLFSRSQREQEKKTEFTGEMSHLRIFPRTRLCQDLARRNVPQVLGYVPAKRILATAALRRSGRLLSEDGGRGREEAASGEADVVRQSAP